MHRRRSRQHSGLWPKKGEKCWPWGHDVPLEAWAGVIWFKVWPGSRGISRMESSNSWEDEIVARPELEMAMCLYVWSCCQSYSKESKEEELIAPSWEGLGTCPKMWPLPLASTLRGQCLWTVVTLLPHSSLSLRPWGRCSSYLSWALPPPCPGWQAYLPRHQGLCSTVPSILEWNGGSDHVSCCPFLPWSEKRPLHSRTPQDLPLAFYTGPGILF